MNENINDFKELWRDKVNEEYFNIEIDSLKDIIKSGKRNLNITFILGLIYPIIIIYIGMNIYHDPNSWFQGMCLGINITCFIFYIVTFIESIKSYKQYIEILKSYEKVKSNNYP